jgi:hypothetical protein
MGNKDKFSIIDFERRLYEKHMSRIKTAIQGDRLYDKIITVVKIGDKFKILDGQHRFVAYCELLDEGIDVAFMIYLRIVELEGAEKLEDVYIALDSAKALTSRDRLKSFENSNPKFFEGLKAFCYHYPTKGHIDYYSILSAIYYGKFGARMHTLALKTTIDSVTDDDIAISGYILSNIFTLIGRDTTNIYFKHQILRTLFRIVYTNKNLIKEQGRFQKFLKGIAGDKFILNNSSYTGSTSTYKILYDYMKNKI